MLEKISKVQNEQMPALIDTIRDQIGSEQAEAFKTSMSPTLTDLYTALSTARETADTSVRVLSGEQPPATDMGLGGMDGGMSPAPVDPMAAAAPPEGSDMDTDGFDATDAAAGGAEELGRGRR